ncbi:MAG: hypothetical protein A4E71_00037 [Smithella sp. PtaU1.Bin162]|nr:MAG: hypothetical protein A4E71_00037 [Smithella sp. PtaU1.Bin162]
MTRALLKQHVQKCDIAALFAICQFIRWRIIKCTDPHADCTALRHNVVYNIEFQVFLVFRTKSLLCIESYNTAQSQSKVWEGSGIGITFGKIRIARKFIESNTEGQIFIFNLILQRDFTVTCGGYA